MLNIHQTFYLTTGSIIAQFSRRNAGFPIISAECRSDRTHSILLLLFILSEFMTATESFVIINL